MSSSVNKTILLGNLVRDPEVRSAQSGVKIINMSVATSEQWKDKDTGEKKQLTEYHRVVIMNERLVDVAEKYLHKGSKVYLEGKLQTRKWTDQSGQERFTTEIMLGRFNGDLLLLDRRDDVSGGAPKSEPRQRPASQPKRHVENGWGSSQNDDLDDEIPF